MNSVRIEVCKDTVGDWETFCYCPKFDCAMASRTFSTRTKALEFMSAHWHYQHYKDSIVIYIERDDSETRRP